MNYQNWDKSELIERSLKKYNHDFENISDRDNIIDFLTLQDTIEISKLPPSQQNNPRAIAQVLQIGNICSPQTSEKFLPNAGMLRLDPDVPALRGAISQLPE